MKYIISIIIPVYNVENYIRDALKSIECQTIGLEYLEVIMVDDCSTDKSGDIIEEYADKYENFIATHLHENSGAAGKPRNVGLEIATGDYVMFLDPDDYYMDDACEILYKKIISENADIVFGRFNIHYENGNIVRAPYQLYSSDLGEIRSMRTDNKELFHSIPPSLWTKIFKRDLIVQNHITFPEGIPGQDLAFVVNAYLKAEEIIFINQDVINYRKRDSENRSISYNRNHKYINGLIQVYTYIYHLYKDNGDEEQFSFTIRGNLLFWIKQFILSDLSYSEKENALDSSWFIFKKYFNLNLIPPKHFIPLFDAIFNKKFDDAILLAEGLVDMMREIEKIPDTPKSQQMQLSHLHSNETNGNYKISIILPVYNVENYIRDALESIIRQTIGFEHLEVIMVNDCSTDNSGEIMEEYAFKYENFIAVNLSKNTGGCAEPRNVGLKIASGEYFMFLDPDDYYTDYACETLYNKITDENASIVFGTFTIQDENGKRFVPSYVLRGKSVPEIKAETIDDQKDFLSHPPSVWVKIFERNFIKQNNIKFPNVAGEDNVFSTNAFLKAKGIIFINKVIVHYNNTRNEENNKSITNNRNEKYIMDTIQAYNLTYDVCKDNNKEKYFISFIIRDKLLYWINHFILADLSDSKKKKALESAQRLFRKFQENNLTAPQHLIPIFNAIANQKYDDAISLAEGLVELRLKQLETPSQFRPHKNQQKKIVILCDKLPVELGGLGTVILNRSKQFTEKGYDVTILTVLPDNDSESIEKELKKRGQLHSNVNLINIYNYFKEKNTQIESSEFTKSTKNQLIDEPDYQVINEYQTKRIVRYFRNGYYLKLKKWKDDGSLEYIDHFNENGVKIRTEVYLDGFLDKELLYETNRIQRRMHFTKDGYCYLNEMFNQQGQEDLILFDRSRNVTLSLSYDHFHKHFLTEFLEEFEEKPYLICDGSGPFPRISNISSDLAYLIGVLHVNPHTEPYNLGGPIRNVGVLQEIENLDALIILTESQRKDIIKQFGDYGNTYVIPNSVPETELINLEKKPNKVTIFCRTAVEKNLTDAIKSFKLVVNKRKSAKLEIFGRTTLPGEIIELKKIKKLINELRLENNVFIKGYITDVHDEMAESVVTLLTSKSEGFGLIILESMVNSTPVISFDINYGPNDLIDHGVNGFLVENSNIEQMAQYIIELLDDTAKAKRMGYAARKKVLKHYTNKVVIPEWKNLFKIVSSEDKTRLEFIRDKLNQTAIQLEISNKLNEENEIQLKQTENELELSTELIKKNETQIIEIEKKLEISTLLINKLEKELNNLATQVYENEYLKNNRSIKIRLFSKFPTLYILFNKKNNGMKNILTNIRGYKAIKKNQLLNTNYYLKNYRDVRLSGMDPILHYMYFGFKEGRNPNNIFDGKTYIETQSDIRHSKLNPLDITSYTVQMNKKK